MSSLETLGEDHGTREALGSATRKNSPEYVKWRAAGRESILYIFIQANVVILRLAFISRLAGIVAGYSGLKKLVG